ncbi:MAG: DUF2272 domain-containing protein [Gammaproteobacteria bacterium]
MAGGFRTCGPTGREFEHLSPETAHRERGPFGAFDEPDFFPHSDDCDDHAMWHGYQVPRQSAWDAAAERLEQLRDRAALALTRAVDSMTIRVMAANTARCELQYWNTNNLTENRRDGQIRIQRYWKVGVNRTVTRAEARDIHWSAAFIDFVMRRAGAGGSFRYAWKHVTYVHAAIRNLEQNTPNTFKAYKIDDPRSAPDIGDLVCNWRGTPRTYDDIAAMSRPYGYTHCDVVVGKSPGGRKIQLIGGNKTGGKVAQVEIDLGQNGLILDQPAGKYIAVMKHS